MRVLLVDDDELVRRVVTEVLCDAGFEVTAAASPDEALSLPTGISSPSVLITDIDLGLTLTGFDVAEGARQRWPDVGIILMSGLSATHTGRALDPQDRYLQKPFYNEHLLRIVTDLVSNNRNTFLKEPARSPGGTVSINAATSLWNVARLDLVRNIGGERRVFDDLAPAQGIFISATIGMLIWSIIGTIVQLLYR